MKLVFIHGRAQGAFEALDLKATWIKTLNEGLKKSGLTLPISEEDVIFPYYGKLLDKLVLDFNEPVKEIIEKGSGAGTADAQFFRDFLQEVADNANVTQADIEEENPTEVTEKGILNWPWVQAILQAVDKKSQWSEASLKKFTYDVFLYLTNPAIKTQINNEVTKLLDNEPCLFVEHSLGTVVGYNVLRDHPELKVAKYITLGSPLGISAVKKYLKAPIKMPECVKNGWFNAFDDRDVVALNPLNNRFFDISPSIQNKSDVNNQTENRHGIIGYLNDKAVAKEIYDALKKGI
ncbi:hypothetical protein J8J42_11500 [Chryseobacterium sp. cx-311]|uniref:hypothetical protein n=1 Tax=Marnyiella aurantia TaxID=2758037 RepID=UPI001AE947E3|nr:hypothetical protein [Marnyiella aurantia]MBP0613663.1 hypothetical protein [Marnyiella aurantia]